MNQPIDWKARVQEQRGPAEPTFDEAGAVRQLGVYFAEFGGAIDQLPAVQRDARAAISSDPANGGLLIRIPNPGGADVVARGREGLRRFARYRVQSAKLAALGPDPQVMALERLEAMGFDRGAAAQYVTRLRRETDGEFSYRMIGSLPIDPNFTPSPPPATRGGVEVLDLAVMQIARALEADRRRRTLAAQGAAGEARLAADQAAVDAADAARRATRTVGPYPRL